MDRQTAAEAHAYHICFHKRVVPPQEDELCAELSLALRAMREVDEVTPLVMGETNPKAPEFVCVLAETPSPEARTRARHACEGNPQIRVLDHCIVCLPHWSEIRWGDPPPIPPRPLDPDEISPIQHILIWLLFLSPVVAIIWFSL